MKIITKEKISNEYKNSTMTVSKYWEQVEKDGKLSEEELASAKKLTDTIYRIRHNKNIDDIFIDIFKIGKEKNTNNLANEMGADIGGLESNGLKVVFINIEFGVNIHLQNPKSEDVDKYLKIFELFNLGLENLEQYRKVLSYYHLDEILENKPKIKQQKI